MAANWLPGETTRKRISSNFCFFFSNGNRRNVTSRSYNKRIRSDSGGSMGKDYFSETRRRHGQCRTWNSIQTSDIPRFTLWLPPRLYVFPVGTGGDPRRLGELLLLARRLFKSDKSFVRKTLLFIENREEIVKQLSWDRDSRKIVESYRTIVLFFDLIFDIFSVSTE